MAVRVLICLLVAMPKMRKHTVSDSVTEIQEHEQDQVQRSGSRYEDEECQASAPRRVRVPDAVCVILL